MAKKKNDDGIPRELLGYDPTEDDLRRREFDLDRPQRETTRPATIFRIRF
jgi:hypothetical protein